MKNKVYELMQNTNRDSTITRTELAKALNTSDRSIRQVIEELRTDGKPICSSSRVKGYWIGTPEEVFECAKEQYHRGYQIIKNARKQANSIVLKGQICIGVENADKRQSR